jgi:hypothetical protein
MVVIRSWFGSLHMVVICSIIVPIIEMFTKELDDSTTCSNLFIQLQALLACVHV